MTAATLSVLCDLLRRGLKVNLDDEGARRIAEEAGLLLPFLAQPPETNLVTLGFGRLRNGEFTAVARWSGYASPADNGWAAVVGSRRDVEAWAMAAADISGAEKLAPLNPGRN